jgi:HEAT repeat protein
LWFRAWQMKRRAEMAARIAAELGGHLPTTTTDPVEIEHWVAAAAAYPRSVVRDFLEPVLSMTVGEPHDAVEAVWRKLGFLTEDLALSRSRFLARRVRAMRRLSLVAGPGEAAALLERRNDVHVIRIMVAQILVRIGSPEELKACFAGFSLTSRLLEQPLAEVLGQVTVPQVTALLELLSAGGDPCVQRLVLVAAARIAPDGCLQRLPAAAAHTDRELRIGACQAVAVLGAAELAPLLVAALVDPLAEVRAQAAKALGRLRVPSTIEPLALALEDNAFWVRQNAAASLGALGLAGRRRLQAVADAGADRYAVDSARQELRRLAALAQRPLAEAAS